MRKSLFSIAAASVLIAGAAAAQTTTSTTTTWTPQEGTVIRQYSTTQNYAPYTGPAITPTIGATLPQAVTVYPLPPTVQVQTPNAYSYAIINNQPVVVDRTDRRIVHVW